MGTFFGQNSYLCYVWFRFSNFSLWLYWNQKLTVWYFRTFFLYFFPFIRSISSPLFLFPFHCPFLSIAWKLLIDRPFSDFPTLYLTFYCLQLLPFLTPLLHILSLHLSFFFPIWRESGMNYNGRVTKFFCACSSLPTSPLKKNRNPS